MGAGKSAVGAELADVLDVPFLDNDLLLTGRTGSTAANLAEQLGGAALHRQELAVLESALERRDRCVIGAAASTVEAPRIKDLLAPHLVVWLTANVATLVERVRGPDHRPFLDDDPEATIRAQADRRRQTFAALADLVIDTSDQSPLQVALEVAGRITDDHRV
jgi:shikimate kinase